MAAVLLILLLIVPLVELWVIVSVANFVGVPETIFLLVAISAAGAWLLKQQGVATWRRLQLSLQRGAMPAEEVTDGALILFGGALLMTPGFITDVVGLFLLLPPFRVVVKRAFRKVFAQWMKKKTGFDARRRPTEVKVVKVERVGGRPPTESPLPPPPYPSSSPDEGDSRDRT